VAEAQAWLIGLCSHIILETKREDGGFTNMDVNARDCEKTLLFHTPDVTNSYENLKLAGHPVPISFRKPTTDFSEFICALDGIYYDKLVNESD
jgi:hypothetical protein